MNRQSLKAISLLSAGILSFTPCATSWSAEQSIEALAISRVLEISPNSNSSQLSVLGTQLGPASLGFEGLKLVAVGDNSARPLGLYLVALPACGDSVVFNETAPAFYGEVAELEPFGGSVTKFNKLAAELKPQLNQDNIDEYITFFLSISCGMRPIDKDKYARDSLLRRLIQWKVVGLEERLIGLETSMVDTGWRFEMSFGDSGGYIFYSSGRVNGTGRISIDATERIAKGMPIR